MLTHEAIRPTIDYFKFESDELKKTLHSDQSVIEDVTEDSISFLCLAYPIIYIFKKISYNFISSSSSLLLIILITNINQGSPQCRKCRLPDRMNCEFFFFSKFFLNFFFQFRFVVSFHLRFKDD